MTRFIELQLEGFDDVIKTFEKLDDKLQAKVMRPALRAGAKVIAKAAKNKSPTLTGKNKRFIKVKALKRSRKTIGVAIQTGTREELGIPRDEFGYYPMALEYGTQHIKKRPFMRPALEQNRGKAILAIGKKMKGGIEKILRGKK